MEDPEFFVPPVQYYFKNCQPSCPFFSGEGSFCTLFDVKLIKVSEHSYARCLRCNSAFD